VFLEEVTMQGEGIMNEKLDRVLRIRQVCEITGLSRATLYRRMLLGEFPERIPLGERSVGWLESEVRAWLAANIARRNTRAPEVARVPQIKSISQAGVHQ